MSVTLVISNINDAEAWDKLGEIGIDCYAFQHGIHYADFIGDTSDNLQT